MKTAIAIAAHPDDIEFMMAGTLLMLKKKGYAIHYINLSSGNLGSVNYNSSTISNMRLQEAKNAAAVLGANFHPPFCNDLEIFYTDANIRKLAAIIREVKPSVLLTHSPSDYMEDHMITSRLAVTAAFAKAMPNYTTLPETTAQEFDCTIYHALPHTLKDQLCNPVIADSFVNTSLVFDQKVKALSAHQSQQSWLDVSQKMNSYIQEMENISLAVGKMSGAFKHAEGWRKHLHVGYCNEKADPLTDLGEDYRINKK